MIIEQLSRLPVGRVERALGQAVSRHIKPDVSERTVAGDLARADLGLARIERLGRRQGLADLAPQGRDLTVDQAKGVLSGQVATHPTTPGSPRRAYRRNRSARNSLAA